MVQRPFYHYVGDAFYVHADLHQWTDVYGVKHFFQHPTQKRSRYDPANGRGVPLIVIVDQHARRAAIAGAP